MANQLDTLQQSYTTYAQALESTAGTFRPSQELIQQTLTNRIQGTMSPKLRGQEIELQNKIMQAPTALREEFKDIADPRERRRLVAGREAQLFSQLSTMKDHRLAREGKYADIVGSVALSYAAETEQLQFYAKEAQRKADQMREIWEFAQRKKEAERTDYEWENFTKPRQALELKQAQANLTETYRDLSGAGKPEPALISEVSDDINTILADETHEKYNPKMTREEAKLQIEESLQATNKTMSESNINAILNKHFPEDTQFIDEQWIKSKLEDTIKDAIADDIIESRKENKESLEAGAWYSIFHSKKEDEAKAKEKVKENITNTEIEEAYRSVMEQVEQLRIEGFTDKEIKKELFEEE